MTGPELIEALEAAGRSDLWAQLVAQERATNTLKFLVSSTLAACSFVASVYCWVKRPAKNRVDHSDYVAGAVALALATFLLVVACGAALVGLAFPEAEALKALVG